MKNEQKLFPLIKKFKEKIDCQDFVIDKTNVKLVEVINYSVELDPSQPLLSFSNKSSSIDYILQELEWYKSMSLSVKEISKKAKTWALVCSKDDDMLVNSNYGWCIFSPENYKQYEHCLAELIKNKYSRRACMIYNRPSMQIDYYRRGMNDFICTFNVQCFIRNDSLIYIVSMRANDFVFGLFNDFAWHCWVYKTLIGDLKQNGIELKNNGTIIWNVNSIHVYEKHFELIKKMI